MLLRFHPHCFRQPRSAAHIASLARLLQVAESSGNSLIFRRLPGYWPELGESLRCRHRLYLQCRSSLPRIPIRFCSGYVGVLLPVGLTGIILEWERIAVLADMSFGIIAEQRLLVRNTF